MNEIAWLLVFNYLLCLLPLFVAIWWFGWGRESHYRRVIEWSESWERLTGDKGAHHEYSKAKKYFDNKHKKRG